MTIFSKIIAGEIPAYKIAEDDQFFAFLDIFPLVEGHVLVIPKLEIDKFFDVPGLQIEQVGIEEEDEVVAAGGDTGNHCPTLATVSGEA